MIDHKLAAETAEAFECLTTMPEEQNLAFAYTDLRRLVKEYFDAKEPVDELLSVPDECSSKSFKQFLKDKEALLFSESQLRAAIGE